MARRYDIEGTRTLLYWAIGLAMLCAWCVRDGWFPTENIQAKKFEYLAFQTTKGDWVSAASAVEQKDTGTWKTTDGRSLVQVVLPRKKVDPDALTLPDQPGITVLERPDRFYFLFNKSFAILSGIGCLGCLILYLFTK